MAVEYNACPLSPSALINNTSFIKENRLRKNHALCRKRRKTCYYICLGTLAQMVHTQIQNKYVQNDRLYLIGSKFVKDLYGWIYQSKHKELFVKDFLRSLIISIAFFAVGVKLTSELVAWRLPWDVA